MVDMVGTGDSLMAHETGSSTDELGHVRLVVDIGSSSSGLRWSGS
ncbi:hypothetical protein I542_5218 [Mycobacteroides abscessus 1948]|uniref:Uncharacterized protein n=1 Tax=Mycobacteroides abscessus 1948 TaxID=1299323 RepID=A0A829QQV8_9MYCO|nr:hypothetical protein MA6G0125S_1129 [Mycobacteroides abscessus 6G-0125-S]EIU50882.1 hypothetical protein MA6G0125R_0158 [Mycobacteroides abscessus 6G-0125-R]EIU56430.1 hypothetical protein MA6G0728S_1456 [Mycobacteroides abscessus 6G-0728-S]EIU97796.1 hypothetical protein MA6G0212_1186 [Mycobacteroides abscessus 6G-0212]EIV29082.1 hypothetical protein MA3A0119R_1071 [Mycobacteroides abscessus 3A-0119-R]EIV83324.1 hypothetical protein MM3A0810R_1143 [Mycobacteroides abscessus 3A-0810-R]EUA6